jgi:hypothetical protein
MSMRRNRPDPEPALLLAGLILAMSLEILAATRGSVDLFDQGSADRQARCPAGVEPSGKMRG